MGFEIGLFVGFALGGLFAVLIRENHVLKRIEEERLINEIKRRRAEAAIRHQAERDAMKDLEQ